MEGNIIKVNGKDYQTYKVLCFDLDIDYGAFMEMRRNIPRISQYDLLRHFYEHVVFNLTDNSYRVNKESKEPSKPNKPSKRRLFGWKRG